MPKARTTCTRCSMRRQKCDKKQPACTRCVEANEADSCTRVWDGGYDANIHRAYPKTSTPAPSRVHKSYDSRRQQSATTSPRVTSTQSSSTITSPAERLLTGVPIATRDVDNTAALATGTTTYQEALRWNTEEDTRDFDHYSRFRRTEVAYLQSCLPNHLQLFQLVEYHEKYLLWHHNCIHGPTFRKEVLDVLQAGSDGGIQFKDMDLRWCGLLFAVLTASLTCATESQAQKWGFSGNQKQHVSKKWHEAAMECLVLGEFASRPHINSVQTIQTLTPSSLLLGLSNQQFVMFGSSLRIAQSLGLQRLPYEPTNGTTELTDAARVQRETNRRIWWNLVLQDWFSISTYDMFSIHPMHFTTPRPRYHATGGLQDDEDRALTDNFNHLLDAAAVMVEFHRAFISCSDLSSKYEQVLKHDSKLRQLSSRAVPSDDTVTSWAPWARQVHQVAIAHKVIILHRHFLGKSFRDPVYAYTRWASIEASKTIVREVEKAFTDSERPSIWNDQSHLTGAGVTLCLDTMNRAEAEPEHVEHRRLVDRVMIMLSQCKDSVLASRGHRLLSSMLKESLKETAEKSAKSQAQPSQANLDGESVSWPIESRETVDAMRSDVDRQKLATQTGHLTPTSPRTQPSGAEIGASKTGPSDQPGDIMMGDTSAPPMVAGNAAGSGFDPIAATTDDILADASWTDMLSEFFPDQLGFGNALDFDDIFNNQYQP